MINLFFDAIKKIFDNELLINTKSEHSLSHLEQNIGS